MNKKPVIIAVSAFLSVCAFAGTVFGITRLTNEPETTFSADTNVSQTLTDASQESTSRALSTSVTDAQSTTSVSQGDLKAALIGKWMDSANMSGFEFFTDGSVELTYVNLTVPVINLPINGTSKGVYTVDGDTVKVTFSIYSASIIRNYKASINENMLTMVDLEENETATYTKQTSSQESTAVENTSVTDSTLNSDSIIGLWRNNNGSKIYDFSDNGTVSVTLDSEIIPQVGTTALSGSYSGVYLEDEGSLIIQYTVSGTKVTEKYLYLINGTTLSLTDEIGDIHLFVRGGTASASGEGALLGTWRDGADMSGYEFKQGGKVNVTYVNFTIPVINMPINGTYEGSYSLSGNEITISFSVYGKSVVDTFTYEVKENTLVLTNTDGGDISTYIKK